MARQLAPGALIWIKDDETVWRAAEIISVGDAEIIVKAMDTNDQILVKTGDPIFLRNTDLYSADGLIVLDDLTQLTHLHEPAVLHSLQMRFDTDKIYTFTGPILIAVNPFKNIHGIYDLETLKSFITTRVVQQKPHVFSIANSAFRGVCDRQTAQTVLISGESGAGKTETTKFVMKFLALAGAGEEGVTQVERQVLESNPLLEAFGNARTLRNDNSSRFGKFIELQFMPVKKQAKIEEGQPGVHNRLCGARIHTYLLERVRITEQQEGERNYHVFYQLCAGAAAFASEKQEYHFPQIIKSSAAPDEKKMIIDMKGLRDHSNFRFLNFSSCYALKDVDDVEQFERTISAMKTIGIQPSEIQNIMYCTSAVLNLGNSELVAPPGNSEGSSISAASRKDFDTVAELIGKKPEELESALCHKTIVTREGRLRSPIKIAEACDGRDALARNLYGLMFLRIVARANETIGFLENVSLFVGVLDIFGFECFKVNSFEQLCINFTNERLQQFFNNFVFKLEEKLYQEEGIPWDPLDFPDNEDSVNLLGVARTGIFAMLDEECVVPQGSDQGFVNKLKKTHETHRRFDTIKTKQSWFVVKHFAGPVPYSSDGFLVKNKDQLSLDVIDAMKMSSNPWFAELFLTNPKFQEDEKEKGAMAGRKKKVLTVSSEFKDQLNSLMEMVRGTDPHFIRCIKPNPFNLPDVYDRPSVCEQLRYGGVLQVVQVSRAGYPVRFQHKEAWDDFRMLLPKEDAARLKQKTDIVGRVKEQFSLLGKMYNLRGADKNQEAVTWAVGKTMVFFKQCAYEALSGERLDLRSSCATKIQAPFRRYRQLKLFAFWKLCAVHFQALMRTKLARDKFDVMRQHKAATKLQVFFRSKLVRVRFLATIRKAVRIQSRIRGVLARVRTKKLRIHRAATKIQARWLAWQERRVYVVFLRGIKRAQIRFRVNTAKGQMRQRKDDARDLGKLLAKLAEQTQTATESKKKTEGFELTKIHLETENSTQKTELLRLNALVEKYTQDMDHLKVEVTKHREEHRPGSQLFDTEEIQAFRTKHEELEQKVGDMTKLLEEKDAKIESLTKEKSELERKYEQMRDNFLMLSSNPGGAPTMQMSAAKSQTARTVDIQFVGASKVGKTAMFEAFARNYPETAAKIESNRNQGEMPIMGRYEMAIGEQTLKVLDCSGNARASTHIRNYFPRSRWVLCVYDVTNNDTFIAAKDLLLAAVKNNAQVVLFGNRYNAEQGEPPTVDIREAKDFAASNSALSFEASTIEDTMSMMIRDIYLQDSAAAANAGALALHPEGEAPPKRASGTWLGQLLPGILGSRSSRQMGFTGVLKPSLKGTQNMKRQRKENDISSELRPVQELQDSESAVTCICFGQERLHKAYILLAAASKDGTVVIYRCYRTEMEISQISDQDLTVVDEDSFSAPPDHSNIAVHSRLVGHTRAITSIFFNLLEDQLVTTSIDKSVRFWSVDSGEMLKVFTDSSPVPVACFLPFNPQVFVAANSNAVLRLVNVQNGMVLQKLKVETEVRALKFDDTGLFLLAGTKNGSIHVLEASDSSTLKFKFKAQLARGGVTCITFVKQQQGNPNPPCLLVNTADSSVAIVDCMYGPPAGVLTNLTVRHRVKVAHSLLPLKNCYSPSGNGYLISGSEDKEVYIYSLQKGSGYKMQYLKHHQVPVVAVSTNLQDTLLASADSLGRIVLWRRMDFSHLPD
eukprot:GEMP01000522.1.p1 GENE.GEMP01000522.1~~GEMP01000522.1.p1  ORF type:complete len:1700 (+),score=383.46 GEMP01000522.1:143-5242(+)